MSIASGTVEATGFIAGILTTISFLPQLVAVYRQKSCKDLSWGYLGTFAAGVIFWLIYGLMLRALPVIFANVVTLTLLMAIMTLKVRYHHSA
jgi:MtN3 and saliva related transmembrane protein